MTRYSLGVRTSNVTIANACVELIAGPIRPLLVRRIEIALVAGTASAFGLGRPAALGITPTSPVPLQMDNGGTQPDSALVALAWGTGPTVPAAFLRRVSLAAAVGPMPAWTFDGVSSELTSRGSLVVPAGTSIVIWNITAVALADINFILDE